MEYCQEYEQEIDLKDLLFHILYQWKSVLLVALILGVLAAGYAVGYNTLLLPEKQADVQEQLEAATGLLEQITQAQAQAPPEQGPVSVEGKTLEDVNKEIEELKAQEAELKELSPVKYFIIGFVVGFFVMAFWYGGAYVCSDKIRGERELRDRYGYYLLGTIPKPKKGLNRFFEKLEGAAEQVTREEAQWIISTNVANLAAVGWTILVTGTVEEGKLGKIAEAISEQVENVFLTSGANMNATASTLAALATCDAVILVEEKDKSLRTKIQKEQESIAMLNKTVLGYVII